ncbi:MAG: phospholipase A [Bacteroidales bacterium]
MKLLNYIFLLFVLMSALSVRGQHGLDKDSIDAIIKHSPAFAIYEDNYFITGVSLHDKLSKYSSDAKFQISIKQRLTNTPVIWGAYAYLTYTQKSFWDVYMASSPFSENNYNPGVRLIKPIYKKNDRLLGGFSFGIEHQSNGRDSIYSRAWNFVSLEYGHSFSSKLVASLNLNLPFGMSEENTDLMDYIGYMEARMSWTIKENTLIFDAVGRKGAKWDTKGNIMLSVSYKPIKSRNQYIVLQWWEGYGESLIDYTKHTSMLRIGIMLKPTFMRLY